MSPHRTRHWLWLVAWLMVMAAIVASLWLVRRRMVERLSRPESLAQWRQWRAETERQRQSPGPVRRRTANSDEPPALVLLRDHFGAIVATSVLMGTFLFAFLAFVGRGIVRQRTGRTSPNGKQVHGEHHP